MAPADVPIALATRTELDRFPAREREPGSGPCAPERSRGRSDQFLVRAAGWESTGPAPEWSLTRIPQRCDRPALLPPPARRPAFRFRASERDPAAALHLRQRPAARRSAWRLAPLRVRGGYSTS